MLSFKSRRLTSQMPSVKRMSFPLVFIPPQLRHSRMISRIKMWETNTDCLWMTAAPSYTRAPRVCPCPRQPAIQVAHTAQPSAHTRVGFRKNPPPMSNTCQQSQITCRATTNSNLCPLKRRLLATGPVCHISPRFHSLDIKPGPVGGFVCVFSSFHFIFFFKHRL
jgi:hypothetical protein